MALIRYPGSKDKLYPQIKPLLAIDPGMPIFDDKRIREYREPFFGAGAIGWRIIRLLSPKYEVWINDIDPSMAALWETVRSRQYQLCRLVDKFTPSVDAFYDFKARDGRVDCDIEFIALRKLALHRMSVSGFGVKAGGPIGGRSQSHPEYTVGCRWNPSRIKLDIMRLHSVMRRFGDRLRITCRDFVEACEGADERTCVYLDPPYYEKGPMLYKHAFDDADHERLAAFLSGAYFRWTLSYDDHPTIRTLYSWASFHELSVRYSNAVLKRNSATATAVRPKNREVVITPN